MFSFEIKGGQGKYPNNIFNRAFGLLSPGRPLKFTNFNPPHASPPFPASHLSISLQARSLTALCIGTIVLISAALGLWFLRAMAAKNCASEGYTQFPSVFLGIEDTTRSWERPTWGKRSADDVSADTKRSHVDRLECSTGHVSAEFEVLRSTWQEVCCEEWSTGQVAVDDEDEAMSRVMRTPNTVTPVILTGQSISNFRNEIHKAWLLYGALTWRRKI